MSIDPQFLGLPQLSGHSMLRDGQRCLGSHEVVAGVMAMSAHLTQDAGGAHTAAENKNITKGFAYISTEVRRLRGGTCSDLIMLQKLKWNHLIGYFVTHILHSLSLSTEDVWPTCTCRPLQR